jgi:putative phosphoribosyl transferase
MFRDRADAARQLAERLKGRKCRDPLVLAIPRGGVVTGAVLARELNAELDVVLARKLRAPGNPEVAVGAVGEGGEVFLGRYAREWLGPLGDYLEQECQRQMDVIEQRGRLFRGVRPAAPVEGRSVIVTDDGIATGSTMIAALKALRTRKPHELIVAVPVAPPDRLEEVRPWCDEVVCLHAPAAFWAIGQFYDDFTQVEDVQAVELLRRYAQPNPPPAKGRGSARPAAKA